jgi:hypothetical protein
MLENGKLFLISVTALCLKKSILKLTLIKQRDKINLIYTQAIL